MTVTMGWRQKKPTALVRLAGEGHQVRGPGGSPPSPGASVWSEGQTEAGKGNLCFLNTFGSWLEFRETRAHRWCTSDHLAAVGISLERRTKGAPRGGVLLRPIRAVIVACHGLVASDWRIGEGVVGSARIPGFAEPTRAIYRINAIRAARDDEPAVIVTWTVVACRCRARKAEHDDRRESDLGLGQHSEILHLSFL